MQFSFDANLGKSRFNSLSIYEFNCTRLVNFKHMEDASVPSTA